MAVAAATGDLARDRAIGSAYFKSRAAALLSLLVSLWIFSGGFVISEPAPYAVLFLLVLAVGAVGGWTIHRGTAPLLVLFFGFVPFAIIGAFQVRILEVDAALIYVGVTIFLFFTAYFIANYVAEDPQTRMGLIVKALIASAIGTALLGIGGYLGLIPGGDFFTRYGRAMGAFQDPNVFAPYVILPAMYLLQRIFLAPTMGKLVWPAALFMILLIGVFVSFSRAAWGSLAVGAVMVFLLVFFLEAKVIERARMLVLAATGALVIVVSIVGLLSIPSVQELFDIRATDQAYDEGESGRFGRQGYAFDIALQHPWGIGPLEFGKASRVREEPHNSYVNTLHAYGWGGGFFFTMMTLLTVWRSAAYLFRPSPNRLLLIPLTAAWIPLAIEAAIIDVDHWRHYFLLAGLIWGVTAAYDKVPKATAGRRALV